MSIVRARAMWVVAAAVLALGLATMFWSAGRGGGPATQSRFQPPVAAPPTPPPGTLRPSPADTVRGTSLPPVSLEGGRITGSDATQRLQWELRAQTVETSADQQEVGLVGVEGKFFERGTLVASLTAPRATLHTRTQDVTLTGGVRAQAGGRILEAERVAWLATRHLLIATGGVRLVHERITVRADRLESDIGLRRTRLVGNIRVTVKE